MTQPHEDEVRRVVPAKSRGGKWVRIGDEEYRIAALGFGALQELGDEISKLAGIVGIPSKEQMDTVVKVVHTALQRNYPNMKFGEVYDMLDLSNFSDIMDAVLNMSGFVKRNSAPGETRASIGTGSTLP